MASDIAVSAALAFLHELFPTREIGPNTLDAFAAAWKGLDDDELRESVLKAAQEPGRAYFPSPGEIIAHRRCAKVDAGKVLRQISAMGSRNPNGWIYPSVERVRLALGDEIADAYAAAGTERCFAADGSVMQDMARRTFAAELTAADKNVPATGLLGATAAPRALLSGERDDFET